jgi:hypothetical protein
LASLELRALMTRRTVAALRRLRAGSGITGVPEPDEGVAGTSGGLLNSTVNIADLGRLPASVLGS